MPSRIRGTALAALLCACAGAPARAPAAGGDAYPAPPPFHLPAEDFVLRQRVVAHWQNRRGGFDAVLQKRGERILVVGLTPFGAEAFELEWQGKDVRVVSRLPAKLPFSARFVFYDIARTYFVGIPGAPLPDGVHAADLGGERITEVWKAGRLVRRTFVRRSGKPAGEIRIDYTASAGHQFPTAVRIENGWFGYRLSISTLGEQRL